MTQCISCLTVGDTIAMCQSSTMPNMVYTTMTTVIVFIKHSIVVDFSAAFHAFDIVVIRNMFTT